MAGGGASKAREQSVYAEPIPIPAPNAIDAHLVTGLPTVIHKQTLLNPNFYQSCVSSIRSKIRKSLIITKYLSSIDYKY